MMYKQRDQTRLWKLFKGYWCKWDMFLLSFPLSLLLPDMCTSWLGLRCHLGSVRTRDTFLEDGKGKAQILDGSWSHHASPKLPISILPLHEIKMTPHSFQPLGFLRGRGRGAGFLVQQGDSSLVQSIRCIFHIFCPILLLFSLPSSNI